MTAFENRRVILAGDGALVEAFAEAFAHEGAAIERLTETSNLVDRTADAFILTLPHLPPGAALAQGGESLMISALTRAVQLIRVVGAGMIARKKGVILIVGGLYGLAGFPGHAAASALEGALIAFLRSVACEWADDHVRLVYLACGAVENENESLSSELTITKNAVERTPMKRVASYEEIAQTALYLAGDRASFLTGSVVRVDGGWTSWGLLK
jgi:NAD(P)-dependent dehydrogenase (short-subunit alcohol dehydrogenase family)